MTNTLLLAAPASSFSAASAFDAMGMVMFLLRCISRTPVPAPASCSARRTSPSVRSSSVSGAAVSPWASWRRNPWALSSSAELANRDSRKCSDPSSRVSVSRVDANSIFSRTGAASGM